MRWLKIILGSILALVVLAVTSLWLAGMRESAGRTEAQTVINKPAAEIMPWVIEPDKLKQWVGGFVSSKDISNIGMKVGTMGETVVADPNRPDVRFTLQDELTAYEPGKLIELKISSPGAFHGTVRYELSEAAGATTVTFKGQFEYDQWWARLMEPLITPSAQKKSEEDLARLKKAVEAAK